MSNDVIPKETDLGLQLYRHTATGMVPDPNGTWIALKDARHQHNAMQSQLVSAGLGDLPPGDPRRMAHQARGDMFRIWEIIGDVNQRGVKEDVFERLHKLIAMASAMKIELQVLRKANLEYEQKQLNG